MPPWASHHVMLEVAGHTGQTTFPNTRLHKDRPASPTFIFSSGFQKSHPKKIHLFDTDIREPKTWHHTNPHCPHRPFGPPSVVSRGTWYAHVALVWCIWAHHTPPGHQVSGMRTSGQQVQGIIPLLQFIELNFGPFWWEFRSPKASHAFGMGSFEVVLIQQDSLRWSFWAEEQHWNQALGWPTKCPA